MFSKLNQSTFPFHISPDQKKWVPDPRSSGNWIINPWYGATVCKTEWLKDIPQAIEEEAQFIHSMLKDPNQLSKMSEANLRLATQEMPNTFDVLNHYRGEKRNVPTHQGGSKIFQRRH